MTVAEGYIIVILVAIAIAIAMVVVIVIVIVVVISYHHCYCYSTFFFLFVFLLFLSFIGLQHLDPTAACPSDAKGAGQVGSRFRVWRLSKNPKQEISFHASFPLRLSAFRAWFQCFLDCIV